MKQAFALIIIIVMIAILMVIVLNQKEKSIKVSSTYIDNKKDSIDWRIYLEYRGIYRGIVDSIGTFRKTLFIEKHLYLPKKYFCDRQCL